MMKKFLYLILILCSSLFAQEEKKGSSLFLGTQLAIGNYVGIDVGLNYIYKDSYSFSIGHLGGIASAKEEPDDHDKSGFLSSLQNVYDSTSNRYFTVGKIFRINNENKINVYLGYANTTIRQRVNWTKESKKEEGYDYVYQTDVIDNRSLVVGGNLQMDAWKYFGFVFSSKVIINKEETYYGIGVGVLLGKLK